MGTWIWGLMYSFDPLKLVIALSHYYLHPSGDMIPDPDGN